MRIALILALLLAAGDYLMIGAGVRGARAQGLAATGADLYTMRSDLQSRWSSFENPSGAKGAAAAENKGAKGRAYCPLNAGETVTLMHAEGPGTVHRMWFTMRERDPQMLRALRLDMFWDGAEQPAVSVPFGDFFCAILGRLPAFENALFTSPEGRSFNCYVPMPFKTGARITLTNESDRDIEKLFYDVNYTLAAEPNPHALYFHAHWRRERWTALGEDFAILSRVEGAGRFLGAHIGVIEHPKNVGWWGEGEVKMYLDGDKELPTIAGTGTEDYIGTGWGQGLFQQRYQGSLVGDDKAGRYGFYRYHIPDPIYFHQDLRVTIQQLGGAGNAQVREMLKKGVEILPVSVEGEREFIKLLEDGRPLDDPSLPTGWTNLYRRDDVCAVALFYLDRPENGLPSIQSPAERMEAMEAEIVK